MSLLVFGNAFVTSAMDLSFQYLNASNNVHQEDTQGHSLGGAATHDLVFGSLFE